MAVENPYVQGQLVRSFIRARTKIWTYLRGSPTRSISSIVSENLNRVRKLKGHEEVENRETDNLSDHNCQPQKQPEDMQGGGQTQGHQTKGHHNQQISVAEQVAAFSVQLFQDFVHQSNLIDLDLKGNRFTWFSNPRQAISSDHSPILLDVKPEASSGSSFKYEAYWDDHEECKDVVAQGWQHEESDQRGWDRINTSTNNCTRALNRWHHKTFLNAKKELPKLKQRLNQLQNSGNCSAHWKEVSGLRAKRRS
ncbi:hypothetical protein SESBI_34890 [Sesbania bispinosa]|nr:hypothetical protein SESBI_34890 [Sesbania bispinosa]